MLEEMPLSFEEQIRHYPDEARRILANLDTPARPWPEPVAIPNVEGEWPRPVLAAAGKPGAILSVGEIALLAGAGGIGKSALVNHIALALAMQQQHGEGDLSGRVFRGTGGPTLIASYEDPPAVTAQRLRNLSSVTEDAGDALASIHVLPMASWPMFGPMPGGSVAQRPVRLAGWDVLHVAMKRVHPALLVIDPALSAFVGNQSDAAAVREFVGALADAAKDWQCGVLICAHSTKSARDGKQDPFDPGQISGSAAWVDACRGALALTLHPDKAEFRRLAIVKVNYGPSRLAIDLSPRKMNADGAIVGFDGGSDGWQTEAMIGAGNPPATPEPTTPPLNTTAATQHRNGRPMPNV